MIVSSRVVFKIAIGVSVLAVFCVLLACTKSPNFVGTVMNPVRPAPDFGLFDQSGNPVSLSKIKSDIIFSFHYEAELSRQSCEIRHLLKCKSRLALDKVNDFKALTLFSMGVGDDKFWLEVTHLL